MANVAEYIIQRLADVGIGKAFVTYGGAISDLVDALPGRMEYVAAIHEQGGSFMAEGYAKAGNRIGLAIGTSGPGGQNMVTGIANCFFDGVPCIFLTGQVATKFMKPAGSGLRQLGFQEWNVVEAVRGITKYAEVVMSARDVTGHLSRAIMQATTGRKGPVLLDLPNDVQRQEMPAALVHGDPQAPYRQPPFDEAMQFLDDLKTAKRPGILVGGGAYASRKEIMAFAVAHCLPVFRTWNALDICPDDHPCFAGTVGTYGGAGRNFGIQNTDLLLCLGTRLSGRITGGVPESFARGAKLYVVDVDPALLDPKNQPRKADVNVLSDAGRFVEACYA